MNNPTRLGIRDDNLNFPIQASKSPCVLVVGEIRTHGGPSIAHDGTQVSIVMSPIDQTLAQLLTTTM
jgi:hypothetical protein